MQLQTQYRIGIGTWVWFKWCSIAVGARLMGMNNRFIVNGWGREGTERILKPLNIHLVIEDCISSLPKNKPVVLTGNHPGALAFTTTGTAVYHHFDGRYPRVVGALKHAWHPLGWALMAMDGILISQTNKQHAIQTTEKQLSSITPDQLLLYYPEGHRAYPERIRQNQEWLRSRGQYEEAKRFTHTLSGRLSITQSIAKHVDATWIGIYTAFDRPDTLRISDMHNMRDATLHVKLFNLPTPSSNKEEARTWTREILLGPCNDWINTLRT